MMAPPPCFLFLLCHDDVCASTPQLFFSSTHTQKTISLVPLDSNSMGQHQQMQRRLPLDTIRQPIRKRKRAMAAILVAGTDPIPTVL